MVSYKELGLVNTRDMFAKAVEGGYAIPAINFNNMEQLQAIIKAASEEKSPVILQVSKGARNYANATLFAIWLKVLLLMLKNLVGKTHKSFFTSTTAIASSFANLVSTAVSLQL